MVRQLWLIGLLVRMHIRSRMEYRGSFLLERAAQILSYGSVFVTLGLLLAKFGTLGGWTWPDMALLFSFQLLGYSLGAALSFVQLRDMEELVRLGTFDTLLVKPFSPWAYLIFSGLNVDYISHVLLALGIMIWAVLAVDVQWSVGAVAFLIFSLISATMITAAVITMIGATALIWVRSNHLYTVFFGFWELTRYPLNIFPGGLQFILVTVMPLGLISSVPVGALLGKPVPLLGDWAGPVVLIAGPLWVLLAVVHWRYAISKYQGAGG